MVNLLTVNLRFDTERDGAYRWTHRRESMRSVIERAAADIIATQEGRHPQLLDLHSLLPGFRLADGHRNWLEHRMYPCIFVREALLQVESSGDEWLSDTPQLEESQLEQSNYPRLLSWAVVRDRRDGERVVVANVHLDNAGPLVRRRQLEIAAGRLRSISENTPVILCGDFNDGPSSDVAAVVERLLPELYDPWRACCKLEQSTFRGFGADGPEADVPHFVAPRIDWVLLDRRLTWAGISRVEDAPGGMPPSDHYPVLCRGIQSVRQVAAALSARTPTIWRNPERVTASLAVERGPVSLEELEDAEQMVDAFAPLVSELFAGERGSRGIRSRDTQSEDSGELGAAPFHSPLRELARRADGARVFAKCDNLLPYAGSIETRGGFYEVLLHAARILHADPVTSGRLRSAEARELFASRTISVASPGNLGISVGLAGRALGFRVQVYMPGDAQPAKREFLRARGVEVIESDDDYSDTIVRARNAADAASVSEPEHAAQARVYFVDAERSRSLFLGYACAARELLAQIESAGIPECPVSVYLPCGTGGAAGGVTFGLKALAGDRLRSFFVEPVAAPGFLYGMLSAATPSEATGGMSVPVTGHVRDLRLDSQTVAGELAAGKASSLALPI
ncbi:MAG: D-serine ammonia-lyase, partial [Spirochaetia bacterium]